MVGSQGGLHKKERTTSTVQVQDPGGSHRTSNEPYKGEKGVVFLRRKQGENGEG